ncbi:MAG: CehA/McbA family metallohydrolase [Actinomycetota bacterium]
MITNPFQLEGEWLRAQLHCHSTNSDGELTPDALIAHYEWAGYDVVAITDHWHITKHPGTDRVLTITGAELNADLPGDERYCDLLVYGIDQLLDDPAVRSNNSFPDMSTGARWANENGGVAYLAHPYWSGVRHDLVVASEGLAGLEHFNASSQSDADRGDASALWDESLEEGGPTFGLWTDDAHYPGFDLDRAWTWVRAAERTPAAVLEALRTGATYGSTGPTILDAVRTETGVEVRCSPARAVLLHTSYELGAGVWGSPRPRVWYGRALETTPDGLVTAARLEFEQPVAFARVVIQDAAGERAWSNPL